MTCTRTRALAADERTRLIAHLDIPAGIMVLARWPFFEHHHLPIMPTAGTLREWSSTPIEQFQHGRESLDAGDRIRI